MQGSDAPTDTAGVRGNLLVFEEAKTQAATAFSHLTDMQRMYCEARLSGMIPLHAARAAGYANPEVNAYRMDKHPQIQKALIAARKMVIEKFDVDRQDVLRGMFDAVQASASATELVAAWREIGRIIGAYEPSKVEIMHKIEDVTLDKLQRMSTKDLIELAEGRDFFVEHENDPFREDYDRVLRAACVVPRLTEECDDGDDLDSSDDDSGGQAVWDDGPGGGGEALPDAGSGDSEDV